MDRSKPILVVSALALYAHFTLQLFAGGLLHLVYRNDFAQAHASVAEMHSTWLRSVQAFHYWGSAVLILQSLVHLIGVTWAGWYRGSNVRGYFAALVFAALAFGFQITGNVLPADRHGVQTAAVEGSIAARVPAIGPAVSRAMLAGDAFSPRTLVLWNAVHSVVLPLVLVGAGLLGAGVLAKRENRRGWALVPALIAALLAVFVASPLGSASTPADFASYDAKPSWYTVPMHGLLVWGGWLGAIGLPAMAALLFATFPLWKPKPSLARGLLVAIGGVVMAAGLLSGGESASLVGTRDPAGATATTAVASRKAETQNAALAARGRALFAAQGCNGCHGQDGLHGVGGPSLAELWRRHPEADYYVRYIRDPQSVKKGSTMPAYGNLTPEELRALAEFLRFPRTP